MSINGIKPVYRYNGIRFDNKEEYEEYKNRFHVYNIFSQSLNRFFANSNGYYRINRIVDIKNIHHAKKLFRVLNTEWDYLKKDYNVDYIREKLFKFIHNID